MELTREEMIKHREFDYDDGLYLGLIPSDCPQCGCVSCDAGSKIGVCTRTLKAKIESSRSKVDALAKQLLSEMDKPKLWDGAPKNATRDELIIGDYIETPDKYK